MGTSTYAILILPLPPPFALLDWSFLKNLSLGFVTLTHRPGHCCYCSVHFHERAVLCRQNHPHVSPPSLCLPIFKPRFYNSSTFPRTREPLPMKASRFPKASYRRPKVFSLTTKDGCKRWRDEKLTSTGCFPGNNQCGGTRVTTEMTEKHEQRPVSFIKVELNVRCLHGGSSTEQPE